MLETLFGEKGKGMENLFISSFRLLGGDEIKSLILSRFIFTISCHLLFLFSIFSITYGYHRGLGILLFILLLLIAYPYSFLFHIKKRACQTWVAYGKITNRPCSVAEAKAVATTRKWPLRLFAIVELTLARAQNSENSGGILQSLVAVALSALDGLYDIAESYLLPAIMIEGIPVTEAADKLRQLKQNVPTTLAGVFGLDIFGGVISAFLGVIYTVIIVLAALAAYIMPTHIAPDLVTTVNSNTTPLHLFLFPLFIAAVLISLIHASIKILITSLKATYFAVFYTAINRPGELTPETKEKVMSYLKLDGAAH